MPRKPYIIEEYVRWSDVDFAASFLRVYVRFFEIAETELFRACGLAYARGLRPLRTSFCRASRS